MRQNLGSEFVLTANLDETTAGYDDVANATANGGKGFLPLGNSSTPFTGTFEGSNQSIEELYINRSTDETVGLFGVVDGAVKNITLENVDVYGKGSDRLAPTTGGTGSLVGIVQSSGVVANVDTDGQVGGEFAIGGLVGLSDGDVRASTASVTVDGDREVGGLIGHNDGTLRNASASGAVTGNGETGGLVGHVPVGTVENSYATGEVNGGFYAGGLVGWINNGGEVTRSYATGNVSGDSSGVGGVGGLVGKNIGVVNESYAVGNVSGESDVGGLVGDNTDTVTDSYWDINTTGQSISDGGIGLTTDQLKANTSLAGFDFTNTWDVLESGPDGAVSYPFLRNTTQVPAPGRETTP
ncbi:MAG: GLUG domain protein [halophilic archaeon J07HX64]|nr:MAG: GLUG domain protein [halophilic archaeon J07HX64]